MRLYILMVMLVMGLMACDSQGAHAAPEIVANASNLVFDPSELDLGEVVEGKKVIGTFLMENVRHVMLIPLKIKYLALKFIRLYV